MNIFELAKVDADEIYNLIPQLKNPQDQILLLMINQDAYNIKSYQMLYVIRMILSYFRGQKTAGNTIAISKYTIDYILMIVNLNKRDNFFDCCYILINLLHFLDKESILKLKKEWESFKGYDGNEMYHHNVLMYNISKFAQ